MTNKMTSVNPSLLLKPGSWDRDNSIEKNKK